MSFTWDYPVFVIPHGGGFVSVPVESSQEAPQFAVTVFTSESLARQFMETVDLDGSPAALKNDREFAFFASALKKPCTAVVFDSQPEGTEVCARWQIDVPTLLEKHLPGARSPWDYPVFVLAAEEGYALIQGAGAEGSGISAVVLFTDAASAEAYCSAAGFEGAVEPLDTPEATVAFLQAVPPNVTAVAVNPRVEDGRHRAKTCVRIATLLEKYLK